MTPSELPLKFKAKELSFKKLLSKVKSKPPKNLDVIFEELHEEVFENTDCLSCANCCKTTSPMFFEKDIERLAEHLKLKPGQFIQSYLFLDTDGIYGLKQTPCPFLGVDNYCSVYEYRPKACREFPHTNHRKMHTHLHLAQKNASICPAVFQILEKLESKIY